MDPAFTRSKTVIAAAATVEGVDALACDQRVIALASHAPGQLFYQLGFCHGIPRPLGGIDTGRGNSAHLILSDSGGVQEEAPTLGKPVLVLRDETERPEGVAAGTAELVGPHAERIIAAATRLLEDDTAHAAMAQSRNPYGDGTAAKQIVDALTISWCQTRS